MVQNNTPSTSVSHIVDNGVANIKRALTLDEVRAQNAKLINPNLLKLSTSQIRDITDKARVKELKKVRYIKLKS